MICNSLLLFGLQNIVAIDTSDCLFFSWLYYVLFAFDCFRNVDIESINSFILCGNAVGSVRY